MSKPETKSIDQTLDWQIKEIAGLKLFQADNLLEHAQAFTHAFTTRIGGASPKPYDSFNLGRHIQEEAIINDARANRKKLCNTLNLNFANLTVPSQKHTDNVAIISKTSELPQTDALITQTQALPILLTFADCVPIIAFDYKLKIFAGIHAGWKGTASSILIKTLKKMFELGSQPNNIILAIGPAIGSCCYPTSESTMESLKLSLPQKFHSNIVNQYDTPHPDLKAINHYQALSLNITNISVSNYCTSCHNDFFYSHRKENGLTGRQALIASL